MRRIDVFLYAGEADMLACRMATLGGRFDAHLAVVANRSHQGDVVDVLGWAATARALGVDDVFCADLSMFDGHSRGGAGRPDYQVRERAHRDQATEWAAARAGADGLVYLSDVDEIPRPELVDRAAPAGADVWVYAMRMHPWSIDWMYPGPWWGTTVARSTAAIARGLQGMRDARGNPHHCPVIVGFFDEGYGPYSGGWHLSWWGDDADRRRKLATFSHAELAHLADDLDTLADSGIDVNGVRLARTPDGVDWPVGVV